MDPEGLTLLISTPATKGTWWILKAGQQEGKEERERQKLKVDMRKSIHVFPLSSTKVKPDTIAFRNSRMTKSDQTLTVCLISKCEGITYAPKLIVLTESC